MWNNKKTHPQEDAFNKYVLPYFLVEHKLILRKDIPLQYG